MAEIKFISSAPGLALSNVRLGEDIRKKLWINKLQTMWDMVVTCMRALNGNGWRVLWL
jgi:hypothetical protein